MPPARTARGKSASARSPSPKGRKSARKPAARPAVVSPPTPPVSGSADKRGAGRDSPSTTAASAPVSSGWHATVGAAPVARGRTALARFLAQLFQLAVIAVTPPTAQLMCARALSPPRPRPGRPARLGRGGD